MLCEISLSNRVNLSQSQLSEMPCISYNLKDKHSAADHKIASQSQLSEMPCISYNLKDKHSAADHKI